MKLTSKFLLILMFTMFATLESSNIHKMFMQLNAGDIIKDDIIKYYKTNYDPMLELHNNFFDGCLEHLMKQELSNNKSFFMKMIDKVKDLFTQGTIYEPLIMKDLGIFIKCDVYVNQIISDNYIAKKKVELPKVKSNLVNINQGNARIPKGRAQSEDVRMNMNINKDYYSSLSNKERDSLLNDPELSGKTNSRTTSITTKKTSTGGNFSPTQKEYSENNNGNANSQTTNQTSNTTYKKTTTKIVNGKVVEVTENEGGNEGRNEGRNGGRNGGVEPGYNTGDNTVYSGSTISGAGAYFNKNSDRKIIVEGNQSYIMIGGMKHLMDVDGWIHGLNIDASDVNINYNIAYENYFDTSCESMLEFMKTKYKSLLSDFNMNKDYVHNLQIENRRYIKKIEIQNTQSSELSLKLNSCEQRIQNEQRKKTTLYHNIRDIKRIKVNPKVAELENNIIKLNQIIINKTTEITNLTVIINGKTKECEKAHKTCQDECKSLIEKTTIEINKTCTNEKNVIIIENTRINKEIIRINFDYTSCSSKLKTCTSGDLSKQLKRCQSDLLIINTKYSTSSTTIENLNCKISKHEKKIDQLTSECSSWESKYKLCEQKLKPNLEWEKKYKTCTDTLTIERTTIIKEKETWIIEKKNCDEKITTWESDSKKLITCINDFDKYRIDIVSIYNETISNINKTCDSDKKELNNKISVEMKISIEWKGKYEKYFRDYQIIESEKKTCESNLTIKIEEITKTCDEEKETNKQLYEININKYKSDLDNCNANCKSVLESNKKECSEQITTINTTIEKITITNNECRASEISNKSEMDRYIRENGQLKIDLSSCTFELSQLKSEYNKLQSTSKIDCSTSTTLINLKLNTCEKNIYAHKETIKRLSKEVETLNITISDLRTTILTNYDTYFSDCKKQKESVRKEEINTCTIKITKIENTYTTINKLYTEISTKYDECKKNNNKCEENTNISIKYQLCLKNRDEYKKGWDTCKVDLSNSQTTIINNEKTITTITNNYETCTKDCKNSQTKIQLEKCITEKSDKSKLIETLILQIQTSYANFNLIIAQIELSYNSKIQKLQEIISSTTSDTTQIKITIEYKVTRKEQLISERDHFDKTLREYQYSITSLLQQRKALLDKLDTIDSNTVSVIMEIKSELSIIQTNIDNFNTLISKLEINIRINLAEIARLEAQIAIYKSNEEYYIESINQYNTILINMQTYIDELKKIAAQDSIQNKDGTTISVSIFVSHIDSQDKDIIFTLKNQIQKFEVNIKELRRQYLVEYKQFIIDINKRDEKCNVKINLCQQDKNDTDEKCEKRIRVRIEEIEKSNTTIIINLKAKWRLDLIEIKRKCNDNPTISSIKNNTYNFEIYKQHCITLIEKNHENDCKSIEDIRSFYNQKCIMTALTTTKDLTTFASSDFTDDRNQAMMNRLNTHK